MQGEMNKFTIIVKYFNTIVNNWEQGERKLHHQPNGLIDIFTVHYSKTIGYTFRAHGNFAKIDHIQSIKTNNSQ